MSEMPDQSSCCGDALHNWIVPHFMNAHAGGDAQMEFMCSAGDVGPFVPSPASLVLAAAS